MGIDERKGLRNEHVQFPIKDVYVREPAQILAGLHGQDLLQGRIVDLSDRGAEREAFEVVEVDLLKDSVVVPVARTVRLNGG